MLSRAYSELEAKFAKYATSALGCAQVGDPGIRQNVERHLVASTRSTHASIHGRWPLSVYKAVYNAGPEKGHART